MEGEYKKTSQESKKKDKDYGVTRRGFLTTVGVGAMALAASGKLSKDVLTGSATERENERVKSFPVILKVNGHTHNLLVEPRWSLLYALRELIGLTGSKAGCERGECGACTVLIDGIPRYACLTLAVEAEGQQITTVEGLLQGEKLGPVQQAFLEKDAMQCGYCIPGQIMSVEGLLLKNPRPDREMIRRGVSGNLCRCGTYEHIFKAAERASELKSGS